VILLREDGAGRDPFALLLLERHGSIAFPGAHAFPGGVVDATDADAPGARLPEAQRWAPPAEGDCPPEALSYWVAAVRELFEEVGILLAEREGRLVDGPLAAEVAALRARMLAGEPFGPLLAAAGLVPATHRLFYFARRVTPAANPRRWDTRFLVAAAPRGCEVAVDGTETVSAVWLSPREALRRHEGGEILLFPPTLVTLHDLARFSSLDAVLEDARRRVVRATTPEIVAHGGTTTLSFPTSAEGHPAGPRLVLRGGRWRASED